MPCGNDEAHGVNDKIEYDLLEELVTILLCRNKDIIVHPPKGDQPWWVDRQSKLPHPDGNQWRLIQIDLTYKEIEND